MKWITSGLLKWENQTGMTNNLQINRLVIFAYGNPSRGDDALGPTLLHLLEDSYSQDNIEFIEDFQLQVEHALDLENCDMALFIDASVSCPLPFHFTRLQAQPDSSYTTHAMHPAAVLYVYQQTYSQVPPPTFLLSVRGESFELGESLSSAAQSYLTEAFNFLKQLIDKIDFTMWQQIADSNAITKSTTHDNVK